MSYNSPLWILPISESCSGCRPRNMYKIAIAGSMFCKLQSLLRLSFRLILSYIFIQQNGTQFFCSRCFFVQTSYSGRIIWHTQDPITQTAKHSRSWRIEAMSSRFLLIALVGEIVRRECARKPLCLLNLSIFHQLHDPVECCLQLFLPEGDFTW